METIRGILMKLYSESMQGIYTAESLLGRSLINSKYSLSTTLLLRCLVFPHLTAKEYYRLCEFLNDTLIHMQAEVLNIQTSKMFKTKF